MQSDIDQENSLSLNEPITESAVSRYSRQSFGFSSIFILVFHNTQ